MRVVSAILLLVATAAPCAAGHYMWVEAENPTNSREALSGSLKVGSLTTRPLPGLSRFVGGYIGAPGVFTERRGARKHHDTAVYDVDIPRAGRWAVWARGHWFVGAGDTFSVGVDRSPFRRLMCDGRYGDWIWVRVGDWRLGAGSHKVRLKSVGAGTRLDKFLLTDDPDLNLSLVTVRYEDYPNSTREADGHISLTRHVYRDRETVRAALYLIGREPMNDLVATMRVLRQGSSVWADRKPASITGKGLTKVVFAWPLSDEPEDDYTLVATVKDSTGRKIAEAREVVGKLRADSEREWRTRQARVARTARELALLIQKAEKKGLDASYPAVSLAVMECFRRFAEEDFATGRVSRARWTTGYLLESGRRAMGEVRKLIANPSTNRPAQRYHAGRCEIRDGAFWQDGHPVFFVGFGHFYQIIHDIPILARMGFNIIQPEMGPYFVLPNEGVVDEDMVRSVRWMLDRAAANGIAVNLMLSPHYFPTWAVLKYPDIAPKGIRGGFSRYLIEDERARDVLRKYFAALIPAIKDHPALQSYALTNEPTYINTTSTGLTLFREWLRKRHGSIGALNSLYGTNHGSFDEAQFPSDDSPRGARYDWYIHNQETFLEFHRFLRDAVRKLDPKTPVHIKQMGGLFLAEDQSTNGINHEDLTLLSDISGNDSWNSFNSGDWHPTLDPEYEYDQDWRLQAMYYDFQMSVAPDHPVQNSENHLIRDSDPMPYPARHGRAALWNGAVHGQGATTMWLWDRWSWKYYLSDLNAHRPDWAEDTGRATLDLMRLGKYFAAFPRERAHIAILASNASVLDGAKSYMPEARNCYEALYFSGARAGFVTERQCAAGKLGGYRILIVPDARFVADSTVDAVRRFVEGGGALVVVNDGLTSDEYGRKRGLAGFVPDNGEIAIGAGLVRRIPGKMPPRKLADSLESLLDELNIPRLARARDLDGAAAWGIGCRAALVDGKPAVSLINFRREAAKVTIESERHVKAWKDLITGKTFSASIALEPLDPALLVPWK